VLYVHSQGMEFSDRLSDDNNWSDMSDDAGEATRINEPQFNHTSGEQEAEQPWGGLAEMHGRASAWAYISSSALSVSAWVNWSCSAGASPLNDDIGDGFLAMDVDSRPGATDSHSTRAHPAGGFVDFDGSDGNINDVPYLSSEQAETRFGVDLDDSTDSLGAMPYSLAPDSNAAVASSAPAPPSLGPTFSDFDNSAEDAMGVAMAAPRQAQPSTLTDALASDLDDSDEESSPMPPAVRAAPKALPDAFASDFDTTDGDSFQQS
jgi:hypothetical protein